ncbi:MAG: SulP family inorganic anion transporter [Bacteroidia bacterium]|nr:SulP family inorganic anion transporter [Bacteroidia bacterium]
MKKLFEDLRAHYAQDLIAGLVVFLVALPLCLGIALASGAPLAAGLITGITGGILVGLLSGSQLSVSGPAAGLYVIVLAAIGAAGSFEAFLCSVILAGLLQLALGFMRAGIVAYYFPSAVIKGMLASIGLLLLLKQIPHAFGDDIIAEGQEAFLQADGENTFSELMKLTQHIEPGALVICLIGLVLMLIWERPFIKKMPVASMIPGALLAVIAGILVNTFLLPAEWRLSGEHLVRLPQAAKGESWFHMPDFGALAHINTWITALTLAVVGSMESLLSLEATDKLDPERRVSSPNQELKAQGIGNILCGLIGGLPMTAVIVRSSANIYAGAQSRWSAVFHGLFLLASVLLIPSFLDMIPLAALAAVLLLVGYKLTRISLFVQMYKLGWDQFLPFVATIVGVLLTDLLEGVAIGMVVAVFYILRNNYRTSAFARTEPTPAGERIVIELAQEVSFLNKASVLVTLNELPEHARVLIDGSNTKIIDYDVLEIIQQFRETAAQKHIALEVRGITEVAVSGHH